MARHDAESRSVPLDDLLRPYEPDEPPAPAGPDRPLVTWFWRTALIAAGVSAAIWVVLRTMGFAVPYPLLATLTFGIAALRRALVAVRPPPLPVLTTPPAPAGDPDGGSLADGMFLAVNRWDTRLSWTDKDRTAFANTVLPRLVEIVDERLRLRHSVTRASDPERARQLLGERLWSLLHAPVGRYPTPSEFAAIVAEMEKL